MALQTEAIYTIIYVCKQSIGIAIWQDLPIERTAPFGHIFTDWLLDHTTKETRSCEMRQTFLKECKQANYQMVNSVDWLYKNGSGLQEKSDDWVTV